MKPHLDMYKTLRTQPTPIISPPAKNMKINQENEGCDSHKFYSHI
jgi:hypothetical protein